MSKIDSLPEGKIKKNGNYYGWAFIGVMFTVMGILAIVDKRFQYRSGTPAIEGDLAVIIGIIFLSYGLYSIYHLLFKAEKKEKLHQDFHVLENFKDNINDHEIIFRVNQDATLIGNNSSLPIFYYKLKIKFNRKLYINLRIKQRDKIEFFLWKIGVTRKWDVLTGNYYFDSRYYVQCSNKKLFRIIFNKKVIKLLESFDRDYPPIRDKNGIIVINDEFIQYIEGPYNEQQRIFDPHRGKIKSIFEEIYKIVTEIEKNVPTNISNQHKNQITLLKKNIDEYNRQRLQNRELFMTVYRSIMYVVCTLLIIMCVMSHS